MLFFFQAEDGIRDDLVTGVQTCALPICGARGGDGPARRRVWLRELGQHGAVRQRGGVHGGGERSEERRVGKECRSGGGADPEKKRKRERRAEGRVGKRRVVIKIEGQVGM